MLTRLSRIFLALATAFVLTGQMEAAAAHCARLAAASEAAAQPVKAEMASCHDMAAMTAPTEQPAHHSPANHSPAKDRCECVAVLLACVEFEMSTASAKIEPYRWERPEAMSFASVEPSPALKPPRA